MTLKKFDITGTFNETRFTDGINENDQVKRLLYRYKIVLEKYRPIQKCLNILGGEVKIF